MAQPINVTDGEFQSAVLEGEGAILVDFWATWCGPCRMIAPSLKQIAAEHENVKVVKIDIDSNPMTPGRYGVMSIPTMMVFKDGQVVERFVGAQPKAAILAKVLPHV